MRVKLVRGGYRIEKKLDLVPEEKLTWESGGEMTFHKRVGWR